MINRNFKFIACQSAMALLALSLGGCAATISKDGLEQPTTVAIGCGVGAFTITITNTSEETGGRTNYTVKTKDGLTYQCCMYSPTGFQKAISFGQIPNSDAMCSQMGRSSAPAGAANKPAANCNALLKAAGKC